MCSAVLNKVLGVEWDCSWHIDKLCLRGKIGKSIGVYSANGICCSCSCRDRCSATLKTFTICTPRMMQLNEIWIKINPCMGQSYKRKLRPRQVQALQQFKVRMNPAVQRLFSFFVLSSVILHLVFDSAPCHTFGPLWARGVFVHFAVKTKFMYISKTKFFKKYSIGPAPPPLKTDAQPVDVGLKYNLYQIWW